MYVNEVESHVLCKPLGKRVGSLLKLELMCSIEKGFMVRPCVARPCEKSKNGAEVALMFQRRIIDLAVTSNNGLQTPLVWWSEIFDC